MLNKKAQGLSISYIVVAAIAVIVLVLVALFLLTKFGDSNEIIDSITDAQFSTVTIEKSNCQTYCVHAKSQIMNNIAQWKASQYCSTKYNLDINGNDVIDDGEENLRCWSPEGAYIFCEKKLNDGTVLNQWNCTD